MTDGHNFFLKKNYPMKQKKKTINKEFKALISLLFLAYSPS